MHIGVLSPEQLQRTQKKAGELLLTPYLTSILRMIYHSISTVSIYKSLHMYLTYSINSISRMLPITAVTIAGIKIMMQTMLKFSSDYQDPSISELESATN